MAKMWQTVTYLCYVCVCVWQTLFCIDEKTALEPVTTVMAWHHIGVWQENCDGYILWHSNYSWLVTQLVVYIMWQSLVWHDVIQVHGSYEPKFVTNILIPARIQSFLWIPSHSSGFQSIPLDSSRFQSHSSGFQSHSCGIQSFLQESVGHQKVLQRLVVPPPNVDSEWPAHRKSFLAFEGYYGAFFLL